MITLIVVAVVFFVLGAGALYGVARAVESVKLEQKELATAIWYEPVIDKKTGKTKEEGHWLVTGRYLAIAKDIERRLKTDSESVRYDRIK